MALAPGVYLDQLDVPSFTGALLSVKTQEPKSRRVDSASSAWEKHAPSARGWPDGRPASRAEGY